MSIEQLAKETIGFEVKNGKIYVSVDKPLMNGESCGELIEITSQLEAFAKAMQQQSEPVAIGEVTENGVIWYKQNPHAHKIGTKFYTQPPNTVSLEQYNKLSELTKELSSIVRVQNGNLHEEINTIQLRVEQAIAEAERSAK